MRKLAILGVVILGLVMLTAASSPFTDIMVKGVPWYDVRFHTTLSAALSDIGNSTQKTVYILRSEAVTADLAPTSNVNFVMFGPGSFVVSSGKVLDLSACSLESANRAIFSGAGTIKPPKNGAKLEWFSSLASAITMLSTNETVLSVDTNQAITTSVSVPSTISFDMRANGRFTITAAQTLTIAGAFSALNKQVFFGNGYAVLSSAQALQANWWPSFAKAVEDIATNTRILEVRKAETISGNLTTPATLSIQVFKGGSLNPAVATTTTINGPFDAGEFDVFGGLGTIKLGLSDVKVAWFGNTAADVQAAFLAIPTTSTTQRRRVLFKSGETYTLDSAINLDIASILEVDATGAVFNCIVPAGVCMTLQSDDVPTIHHLLWNGGEFYNVVGSRGTTTGLSVAGLNSSTIERARFSGFDKGLVLVKFENTLIHQNMFWDNNYGIYHGDTFSDGDLMGQNLRVLHNQFNCTTSGGACIENSLAAIAIISRVNGFEFSENGMGNEFATAGIYCEDQGPTMMTPSSYPAHEYVFRRNHFEHVNYPVLWLNDVDGYGFANVSFEQNYISPDTGVTTNLVVLERVLSFKADSNYFRNTATMDVVAYTMDANCVNVVIGPSDTYLVPSTTHLTKYSYSCARSALSLLPSVRMTTAPSHLTGYNPATKTDGNETIDMSSVYAYYPTREAPPLGYYVTLYARDDASAGNATSVIVKKNAATSDRLGLVHNLKGVPNDELRMCSRYIEAETDGSLQAIYDAAGGLDIYFMIDGFRM